MHFGLSVKHSSTLKSDSEDGNMGMHGYWLTIILWSDLLHLQIKKRIFLTARAENKSGIQELNWVLSFLYIIIRNKVLWDNYWNYVFIYTYAIRLSSTTLVWSHYMLWIYISEICKQLCCSWTRRNAIQLFLTQLCWLCTASKSEKAVKTCLYH